MREIKFRAYNTFLKDYDSYNIQESGVFPNFLTSDKHIVEQYTGLKDKNGVEIYEGDIVKSLDITMLGKTLYRIGKITIEPLRGIVVDGKYPIWPHDCEVIGNIHEVKE